jgi:hypothetical protein
MSLQQRANTHTVVLFPQDGCTHDFATITAQHLTGLLNLTSADCVKIVRQNASFLRLQCSEWQVKRHIMSWETRTTAAVQFSIKVKEDLLKYERLQKARMWNAMQAMFHAGLRPSWSRSSITWKHDGIRYFLHPGEFPNDLPAEAILVIVKRRCGIAAAREMQSVALQTEDSTASTQHANNNTSSQETANLVVALQQDVALAKQRTAVKTIECCMLRRKLALAARKDAPPHTTPHTAQLHHVQVQTDRPPSDEYTNTPADTDAHPQVAAMLQLLADREKHHQSLFDGLHEELHSATRDNQLLRSQFAELQKHSESLLAQLARLKQKARK